MSGRMLRRLRGWRFGLFNACLGLAHALVIFNAGAYIAMLPRVAGGLGIAPSEATWTQTDYMMALALAYPLGAWLVRRVGDYRVLVTALVGFAVASWLCAAADGYARYLAARILLGVCGGISLPAGQTLLLNEYPARGKSVGVGVWSVFTLTPFSLGPPIGGWIADEWGWRCLFWANVPIALSIAGLVAALLYQRKVAVARLRLDGLGLASCVTAWFGLQTLLNRGNDVDWWRADSQIVLGLATLLAFAVWIGRARSTRRPYLDLRLLTHRNFAVGLTVLCAGFLGFQGLLSLLIVQLQLNLGYSSWLAGLVFLPMAVFAKPVAAVMHEIVKRVDARWLASLSLAGFSVCYFWLSRFDDSAAFATLLGPKLLEGACLGGFFVPLTALMLHDLPARRHAAALELAGALRIAAGAIGITLQACVLYRRAPLHAVHYAERLGTDSVAAERAASWWRAAGYTDDRGLARLAKAAARQAAIQGIDDAFWLAGCGFAILAALVWLARPTRVRSALADWRDGREEAVMEENA